MTNSSIKGKKQISSPRAATVEGEPSDFWFRAYEARTDEDYSAAAWLRAACLCESHEIERNTEDLKRQFAEKEFFGLRKRCDVELGNNCKCILMVKEEKNNLLSKRVVGTLGLHIRYFADGQTFPDVETTLNLKKGIMPKPSRHVERRASDRYGYILNLCVVKSERRRGHATGMLQHAISIAKEGGIKKVFLHVYEDNEAAVKLYEKVGFKAVEAANYSSAPILLLFFLVY
ncbi:uncharacterized protein LOC121778413 [Salvia splendens]|uniref:uncharacterized protein LOC121778413 n=1 Tax=Salvia splendens TaxID=180675 RepID=UPI001C25191D|nr:uncharacterized protein LOC121778413 [Salvia splendens]